MTTPNPAAGAMREPTVLAAYLRISAQRRDVPDGVRQQIIEAAAHLAAAPDPASVDAVAVKALEWVGLSESCIAHTPFGIYKVAQAGETVNMFIARSELPKSFHATIDEAKAAAQADYEARILSALASDASPNDGLIHAPSIPTCGPIAPMEDIASDASPRGEPVAWMWVHEDGTRSFVSDPDTKRIWEETMKRVLVPVYAHPAPAAVGMPQNLAELIEEELLAWRGANGAIHTIHACALAVSIKLRAALAPATEGRKG